ncbi:MAG: DUF4924 family protein [Crocinitomicaceae bacterium]|nr:DUF4924 family protein [Crocinitomicaceae bacterium]
MSLADQKFRQNVAEYILFLWQMEDLVRAVYFDPESLDDFIRSYTPDKKAFEVEKKWFRDLVKKMRSERVEQRGHISEVHELIFELNYLHNTLLNVLRDKIYVDLYHKAKPNIEEYLPRTDGKSANDVESCLLALYGLLVLRLKREAISKETEEAMTSFSNLMARLAHHYRLMKQGESIHALN